MGPIILATDFSPSSQHALLCAVALATRLGTEVVAVHAQPLPEVTEMISEHLNHQLKERQLTTIHQQLKRFITPYPDQHAHWPPESVRYQYVMDSPTAGVLHAAASQSASLIVIGTRAKHNFWDHLWGSFSTEILTQTRIPVLVIPQGAPFGHFHQVSIATAAGPGGEPLSPWLQQFLEITGANAREVFVDTDPQHQDLRAMELTAADHQPPVTTVRANSVQEGLALFLQKYPSDLLAMHVPRRQGLSAWLHQSLSRSLVYHVTIPLLIIPVVNNGGNHTR